MSEDAVTGGYATVARVRRLEQEVATLKAQMTVVLDSLDRQSHIMSTLNGMTDQLCQLTDVGFRYVFSKVGPPPQAEDPAFPDHTSG